MLSTVLAYAVSQAAWSGDKPVVDQQDPGVVGQLVRLGGEVDHADEAGGVAEGEDSGGGLVQPGEGAVAEGGVLAALFGVAAAFPDGERRHRQCDVMVGHDPSGGGADIAEHREGVVDVGAGSRSFQSAMRKAKLGVALRQGRAELPVC